MSLTFPGSYTLHTRKKTHTSATAQRKLGKSLSSYGVLFKKAM